MKMLEPEIFEATVSLVDVLKSRYNPHDAISILCNSLIACVIEASCVGVDHKEALEILFEYLRKIMEANSTKSDMAH